MSLFKYYLLDSLVFGGAIILVDFDLDLSAGLDLEKSFLSVGGYYLSFLGALRTSPLHRGLAAEMLLKTLSCLD